MLNPLRPRCGEILWEEGEEYDYEGNLLVEYRCPHCGYRDYWRYRPV